MPSVPRSAFSGSCTALADHSSEVNRDCWSERGYFC
uniref:Uncharacterized protein n=1 Tax=Anguilla anguilla TaxID=7936 RepID=A0A0E9Q6X0_ANGAN